MKELIILMSYNRDRALEAVKNKIKEEMKTQIEIKKPKNFMNCSVTTDNHFIADTNDSANWDTLKFPLPKGKWSIYSYKNDNSIVVLQNNL